MRSVAQVGVARSQENVYVNVYDLTSYNDYMYWCGLGIFHSGLEVHGTEYAFGAHDYSSSGVFEVEPRNTPGFEYRTTLQMGQTDLDPVEFRAFLEKAAVDYTGDSYHLITKNCNHFTNDMCRRLVAREVPGWINRLAYLGWMLNCLLPEALRINDGSLKKTPEYHTFEDESGDGSHPLEGENAMADQRLLSMNNSDAQAQIRDRTRDASIKRLSQNSL
eukprot:jgi/Mesen1/10665/ME000009S10453